MTEFNDFGQKIYEGEYDDSFEFDYPRHGKGEEYDTDGKTLLFKGSYDHGRRHGEGISYKNTEIRRRTTWLAGYSKQGLLTTLLIIIAVLLILFMIDVILGLGVMMIVYLLILIRWCCFKLLGHKICNRTDFQLMAKYIKEHYSKKTNTGKIKKKMFQCIYFNIYLSVIIFLSLSVLCISTCAHFYYNSMNIYVSVFQTTYTVKSNNRNDITGFRLSFKPFLKSIEIGASCFEPVSIFQVKGLSSLNSIKIGSNSFTEETNDFGNDESKSFHILNCKNLQSIQIGEFSFSDFGGEFELKNLPALQSLKIGVMKKSSLNFYSVKSFVIEGIQQPIYG